MPYMSNRTHFAYEALAVSALALGLAADGGMAPCDETVKEIKYISANDLK